MKKKAVSGNIILIAILGIVCLVFIVFVVLMLTGENGFLKNIAKTVGSWLGLIKGGG